jgi:hypothetical protein
MNNKFAGLWLKGTLIASALILTSCVAKPPENIYLRGSSETIALEATEPAPFAGWLLSDEALVDLLECCGDRLQEE